MRIRKVESILSSFHRNYLTVKITTDKGITGYGDATLNGRELAVRSVIDDYLSDFLQGRDAGRIEDIWQMIFGGTYWRSGPVLMTALAGIDMALWDIKGKEANMPLYSLLGGKCRDRLRIYVHVHGRNENELLERSGKKIKNGYKVLRYSFDATDPLNEKVVFTQPHQDVSLAKLERSDLDRIQDCWDSEVYIRELVHVTGKMREQFGDKIELIHDVHHRLNLSQAMRLSRRIEEYDLFFLEDPIDPMNREAIEQIRKHTVVPLATGELFTNIHEFKNLVSNHLIDFVRPDISHIGGVTPLIKLSNFGDLYGIQTAFHGPGDISPIAHSAMSHINFCVPNFGIQEYFENLDELSDVFATPLRIRDGNLEISSEPGLGVQVDEEGLKKAPYKKAYLPMLRDQMGAVHNW